MNDDYSDFDEIPWADPKIQADYEAALGAFLLAFNRIDNLIDRLIRYSVGKLERKEIYEELKRDSFSRQLVNLELLSLTHRFLATPEQLKELKALNKERNNLAHGHFEQNPFDGSYEILKNGNAKSLMYSAERIKNLTARAEKVWNDLRYAEAHFQFDAIVDVLPEPPMI